MVASAFPYNTSVYDSLESLRLLDGPVGIYMLLRHLVMPGALNDTRRILESVASELGPDTYVNIMDQYYPAGLVSPTRYPELNRRITPDEYRQAVECARSLGLWRLDRRWGRSRRQA